MATNAPANQPFVEALRQRGLNRLAEVHCRQQLSDESLDARTVVEFVTQLSLIEVDRALASSSSTWAEGWQRAEAIIDNTVANRQAHAAWALLRLQKALNTATRGEAEQLAELPEAADTLRSATKQLEAIAEEVETLRQQANARQEDDALLEPELASLANRVGVEQARLGLLLAGSFSTGSPDRDDAVMRSLETIRRLPQNLTPASLQWQVRLHYIVCYRLLGKQDEALALLNKFLPAAPADVLPRLFAEQAKLLLAADRDSEAAKLLSQLPSADSIDLSLARLELITRQWQQTIDADAKSKLSRRIEQQITTVRNTHGPLWARRAEAIAGGAIMAVGEDSSLETLVRAAEFQYRTGRKRKAVEAYDRAAAKAYAGEARGRAFELKRTAAAVVRLLGDHADAAQRFRRSALAAADHPDSAATHREAILSAAEALRTAGDTNANAKLAGKRYRELLEEHLATWSDSPTTEEARWWLMRWQVASGDWQAAARRLRNVLPDDANYDQAIRLQCQIYQQRSQAASENREQSLAAIATATETLLPVITGTNNRWPRSWTTLQREVASTLATLHSKRGIEGEKYASQLLTTALDASPEPDADWKTTATAQLAPLLASRGELAEAQRRLQAAPPTSQAEAEKLLASLTAQLDRSPNQQAAIAELILSIASDEPWQVSYRAAALAALGKNAEAMQLYANLATKNPGDADLQQRYASVLAAQPDQKSKQLALTTLHQLERRAKKGSVAWFDFRLARLQLMIDQGEREKAGKLLTLTKVLNPNLGGRAKEFAAIEAQVSE